MDFLAASQGKLASAPNSAPLELSTNLMARKWYAHVVMETYMAWEAASATNAPRVLTVLAARMVLTLLPKQVACFP